MLVPLAQDALRSLITKPFAVYFGAGLSIRSGLPSAYSLIAEIVGRLPLTMSERTALLNAVTGRLPFEAFLETLEVSSGIEPLLDSFTGAEPNRNHHLLAQWLVAGRVSTICTTNFDDLVERALLEAGWTAGANYQLISDLDSFVGVDWDSPHPRVIKIHGSIDNRAEMAITLRQVASHQIFEPRKRAIQYLFGGEANADILVLGYSCSDAFDIGPAIESLSSTVQVLFVEHARNQVALEALGEKDVKNPFKHFAGTRLYANTDDVIADLAEMTGIRLVDGSPADLSDRAVTCVDQWEAGMEPHLREAILSHTCASLYMALALYRPAIECYGQALEHCRDGAFVGRLLANMATAYRHLGDLEAAIATDTRALALARQLQDRQSEAGCLGNLSQTYLETGELKLAIECGLGSLEISRDIKDENGVARQLGTLGSIYFHQGALADAERYHQECIEQCQRLGYKVWEVNQLGGLGKVYMERKDFTRAIEYFEQAIKIAEQTGDEHVLTNQLNDLSAAYFELSRSEGGVNG